MSNTQNLGDMIRQLADNGDEVYSELCTVIEVKGTTADVQPLNGKAPILGADLTAGASDTPFLIVPVVESVVMVSYTSADTAFISLYSEIETVAIRGDQFGGLVKIEALVENLDKLTARVDGIINAINNGVPAPTDGGAALQLSIKTGLSAITEKEDFTGIENETIKHG